MSGFCVKTIAKVSPLCACLFLTTLTAQAQRPAADLAPIGVRPLKNARPALVPFTFRMPDGALTTVKLRRLPASCVVRDAPTAASSATSPALLFGQSAVAAPRRVRLNRNGALTAAPKEALALPFSPTGAPRPALLTDPEIYNTTLDYSHDRNADTGWIFPTRGYDPRQNPGGFRISLNSLIYPTDPPYVGSDLKTHAYDNFNAPIELIQLGQPAQISTMRIPIGVARQIKGSTTPVTDLNSPGCIAVILFWDGVYNDVVNGFARDSSGSLRLATDATGASGVIVQLGSGFNNYSVFFDNDGSGPGGRFRITDPKGRMGMTVAAVYDPNAVDSDGNPVSSSREDGVYLRPGASVGQNKYFLIKHGNLDVSGATYDDNGVATTQNVIGFTAGNDGGIFYDLTTQAVDGSVAYQVAPADLNFNPGEGQPVTVNGVTKTVPIYAPLNSAVTLYGTSIDGSRALRGELRGRIRLLGVDPDNASDPTKVVSPYDSTPATPSLPLVPGESKMNRFRFTFISPPIGPDVNQYTLWDPAAQLPATYTYFQQETYSLPSYGDNTPIGTQHGTPLRYNYRLRGIPTGTYSLLIQAIPITDIAPIANGIRTDMLTPYNTFPGSDFNGFFAPSITIGESLFNPPGGDLNELNYDNYTNTTVLDLKLHRLTDVTGGIGGVPDGSVDSSDFGLLIDEFNTMGAVEGMQKFDITGGQNGMPDGSVDSSDFALLIGTYGIGVGESIGY